MAHTDLEWVEELIFLKWECLWKPFAKLVTGDQQLSTHIYITNFDSYCLQENIQW